MKRTRTAITLGMLLWLPCCATAQTAEVQTESYENIIKKMIEQMDAITNALQTVKDDPSAATAKPAVLKAAREFVALRKKAAELKPPNADQRDALKKKYKDKIVKAQKSLFKEVARLRDISAGKSLVAEIAKLLTRKKKKPKKKK